MPLKVNVGLSKKIGLPNYGSLGASVHVEYEADSTLLQHDLDGFHRQVKNAFVACKQAVQDELFRHRGMEAASSSSGQPHLASADGHGEGRSPLARRATVSQVRAICRISDRLQLDLAQWLEQKFGIRIPSELSVNQASQAIDELNSLPTSMANGTHH
jgi:hypothetical protein